MTEPSTRALSVIVPTRDRRERLQRCLAALARQDGVAGEFEVVVVNDGSNDGTEQLLAEGGFPFPLRSVRLEGVGPSRARNAGVELAVGEVCVFLDDDCIPVTAFVGQHLAAHRSDSRLVGIGALTQKPPARNDWYTRAFARSWADHYARLESKQAAWSDCYSGNLSAPLEALAELGGFATDVPVGEDIELGFRLAQRGFTLRYLPRASAVHDDEKPRSRLLDDVRSHGFAYLELAKRHPGMKPKLLGWYSDATPRELALRRALLALRAPVGPLTTMGGAIPGETRKDLWYGFLWRFAFWREVRKLADAKTWAELIAQGGPAQ
jgi:glycosyltransferase involved in cell wall biosynthesis